jgi:streptogramin lyase
VEVADAPIAMASAGDDELWVAHAGGQLTRIEVTADGAAADEPIEVGGTPIAVAVDGDDVWVGDVDGRAIRRVERATGRADTPIVVRDGVVRMVPDDQGGLWVTNFEDSVSRVDLEARDVEPPASKVPHTQKAPDTGPKVSTSVRSVSTTAPLAATLCQRTSNARP